MHDNIFLNVKQLILNWIFGKEMDTNQTEISWEPLPEVIVIEVMKYLSDAERLNMALACKKWLRLFRSPCLWRSREFDLGGVRSHVNGSRALKFVSHLGMHLHSLTIVCSHPSFHTTRIFQKGIESLLSKLRPAQLLEFELERLELDRFWRQDNTKEKFVNCFWRFFKTQRALKVFDMTSAQFPLAGAMKILSAIAARTGHQMQELYIEDFFPSRTTVHEIKEFRSTMTNFTNLNYLALNYSYLSEEMVATFTRTLAGKLANLNIKCYKNDPHGHVISGLNWKNFAKACPNLKVSVWFDSIGKAQELKNILNREIPIVDIHLWTGYDDDSEWNLSETIDYITSHFCKSLESVSLEMDNNHEIVDVAVIEMVKKCLQLRDLTLNYVMLLGTIEEIMELEKAKKIHLHSLHVTACGLNEQEYIELNSIKHLYHSMCEEHQIDVNITTDILIDPM